MPETLGFFAALCFPSRVRLAMVRRPNRRLGRTSGRRRANVKRRPVLASKERLELMRFRLLRLAPAGALLLLMGCSSRILICPVPAILADTQSVTFFRPGTTPDLANELYGVSLVNPTTHRTPTTKQGRVDASLDLTFRA